MLEKRDFATSDHGHARDQSNLRPSPALRDLHGFLPMLVVADDKLMDAEATRAVRRDRKAAGCPRIYANHSPDFGATGTPFVISVMTSND